MVIALVLQRRVMSKSPWGAYIVLSEDDILRIEDDYGRE